MKTIEMERADRRPYEAPLAEVFTFVRSQSLLVSFSAEAGIEDWEEAAPGEAEL